MKLKRYLRPLLLGNECQSIANDAMTMMDAANPNVVKLPYGRYPHGKLVQIFNKPAAEAMAKIQGGGLVGWAKSVLANGWHRLCGKELPCYIGHPYLPGAEKTADKSAKGWLTKIVANEDHAEFHFDWNDEGKRLIETKAFRYISPQWAVTTKGNEAFPFAMESCGLTNNPNTPCTPLANEDAGLTAEPEEGASTGNETTEQEATPDTTTLANDLAAARGEVTQLTEQLQTALGNEATLRATIDTLTTERDEARTLANELRTWHVGRAVDALVQQGRVAIAERESTVQRLATLANDAFVTAFDELATAQPVVKTAAVIDHRAAAQGARALTIANEDPTAAQQCERKTLVAQFSTAIAQEFPALDSRKVHSMAWDRLRAARPDLC